MSYQYSLYESVAAVPAAEWNAVCAGANNPFMDLAVIAAIECSMSAQGKFFHVIVRDETGQPMACAALCLFFVDGAVLTDGAAKRFGQRLRRLWPNYMRFNALFCGLPVSAGQKHLRLHPAADSQKVMRVLDGLLCQLARKERAWIVVAKEFDEGDRVQLDALTEVGYLRVDSLPMNHFEPRFKDFDDYCRALRSHYRYKIKKSRAKFEQAGLRVEQLVEPGRILETYTDEVHKLYEAVVDRSEYKLELLPAEFFRELTRRLPGRMSLTVVRHNDRVAGFAWGLLHGSVYRNLFIGIDYSLSPETDLYFNLMLCDIEFALAKGVSDIMMGQTADDFKSRLGCYHQPRYLYLKAPNRLFHWLIRRAAAIVFAPPVPPPDRDLFKPT